jgi:hypothetical protein
MDLFDKYPVSQESAPLVAFGWFSAIQIILGRHIWPITRWDMMFPQCGIWSQGIVEHPVYMVVNRFVQCQLDYDAGPFIVI